MAPEEGSEWRSRVSHDRGIFFILNLSNRTDFEKRPSVTVSIRTSLAFPNHSGSTGESPGSLNERVERLTFNTGGKYAIGGKKDHIEKSRENRLNSSPKSASRFVGLCKTYFLLFP